MRNPVKMLVFWALIVSLAACSALPGGAGDVGGGKTVQSQAQRIANPDASPADVAALAAGNTAFALDFLHAAAADGGNLFFSPYSLSAALAMTYAGARNQTEAQMAQVMHYTLPQARLHPAFNALDLQIAAKPAGVGEAQAFQLSIANSLWGQDGYQFLPEYLDLLALNYGAGMRLVDFRADAEAARGRINRWVEDQTQKRIQNLIPQGGVNADTRLVLANAIYFKADWLHPFEANNTRPAPFHRLDGSTVDTPMMSFKDPQTLGYTEGDGYQAVELPYQGGQVSLLLLVPESGRYAEFEAGLDAARLQQIIDGLQPGTVSVVMPKFEYTQEYALAKMLSEMGMPDAFCDYGDAFDFSGIDGTLNLCIGQVFHKAFVAVDEKGTEAAAASAVVMQEVMAQLVEDLKVVQADRPFIYLIRHNESGSVLFVGRLLDPAL